MKETKDEVIGVVFSKLRPKRNEVFADIGCGTGKVANFFSDYVSKVYAVDLDDSILGQLKDNVEFIRMHGIDFLKDYDYDVVFFGGTKDIDRMIPIAVKKARRVAINLARVELACKVVEILKDLNALKEVLIVNVFRGYELAGMTAFKPINPVFVIVGERR